MMWSDKYYETKIKDEYDGKGNTEKLIAYGKKCKINFPAAEWCVAYCKNGVRPGEGFMPAKEQLKRIVANRMIVNPALQKIDGIIRPLRSVCSCLLGKLTKNSLRLQGVFLI